MPVPDRKFIVQRFGNNDDDPYGYGLGPAIFWPVFFKKKGLVFWLQFAERFGSPTVIAEYPPGMDEYDQRRLLAAVRQLSNETGIVVPQGIKIRFLEAQRYGTVDTYEKLCKYMDDTISIAVLGQTLGASDANNSVRTELTNTDADRQCVAINDTLLRWITEVNLPGVRPPMLSRRKPLDKAAAQRMRRDEMLLKAGLVPAEGREYFRRHYGQPWIRLADVERTKS